MSETLKILVVDDNRTSAQAMARILTKLGHSVTALFEGQSAINSLETTHYDLVFTDLKMEPVDGMAVLRAARNRATPLEVIVFTAFGAVEHAVEALQLGARDFLTKPISVDQILSRVRALTGEDTPIELEASELPLSLRSTLEAVAAVPSPVWLIGELGSGRKQAAEFLHSLGQGGPLVEYMPGEPLPDSGTLLFRDIDEMNDEAQATAAQVLRRLPPGLKLVATAREGARERVANGSFRSDLYYALAVLIVKIPALRDRSADVPELFDAALRRFCTSFARPVPQLTEDQREQLRCHTWPANLRELHNLAERTAVLGLDGFNLVSGHPTLTVAPPLFGDGFKLSTHLEAIERSLLAEALMQAKGDRAETGRLLGVERNTLRYKLNKYGLLKA